MSQDLPNHRRDWSVIETDLLHEWWGQFSLDSISRKLGRTPAGIFEKARKLKLGAFSKGVMSMTKFETLSGFSRSRIHASAEALGIKLKRSAVAGLPSRTSGKKHRAGRKARGKSYDITEEQQGLLITHFTEHPGIFVPNKPGYGKSTPGVWGIGRKPPACIICNRNDRPHYAKSRCANCYQLLMRENKRKRDEQLATASPSPPPGTGEGRGDLLPVLREEDDLRDDDARSHHSQVA